MIAITEFPLAAYVQFLRQRVNYFNILVVNRIRNLLAIEVFNARFAYKLMILVQLCVFGAILIQYISVIKPARFIHG